jgi:MFS family permease
MTQPHAESSPPPAAGTSNLPWAIIWALSVTQIVSWGTIYYAISVLLPSIEAELGWSRDLIIGAFSLSLLFAAGGALPAGVWIDRYGGRWLMACGSIAAGVLFILMGEVHSLAVFYLLWIGLGLCMAILLYEPAFAVITQTFREHARKGITVLALSGGFASTVFWPVTQALVTTYGWRHALIGLGLCNLLLCAPLHARFLPASNGRDNTGAEPQRTLAAPASPGLREVLSTRVFWLLAVAFTGNMLAFSALSVHIISLLHEKGFGMDEAVWIAALVGPMQVMGRVGEFTIGKRFRPTQIGVFALSLLPVALVCLTLTKSPWLVVLLFIVPYGTSNGIMTIIRGIIPIDLFGRERYGTVNGALATPVAAARALGPFVVAAIWSAAGGYDAVLWTLAAVGLLSLATFTAALAVRKKR